VVYSLPCVEIVLMVGWCPPELVASCCWFRFVFQSIDRSSFSPRLWRTSFDVDVVNERNVQLGGHIILKFGSILYPVDQYTALNLSLEYLDFRSSPTSMQSFVTSTSTFSGQPQ
jgi:hypothetical protein